MIIILKLILFFVGLWFFGWQFTRWVLKESRQLYLGVLGLAFGISIYVFLINILSYFIKPPLSFFLTFFLLLILGLGFFVARRQKVSRAEAEFSKKQIKTLIIIAMIVSLVTSFIAVRTLERDDYLPSHILAAALFTQGNFPPKNPISPVALLSYHYAPDLFSAALNSLTDIPLWLSYDVQTGLFTGLIMLLAFIFIYQLCKNYQIALVGAFGTLYAGDLNYLLTFPFLRVLYKRFILGEAIAHPFKLLADIPEGELTKSLINQVHFHTPALGFLIVLLVLYLFWQFYQKKLHWSLFGIIGGTLFGFLALSQETTFVILFFAFLILLLIQLTNPAFLWWSIRSRFKECRPDQRTTEYSGRCQTKEKGFSLGLFIFLIIAAGLSLIQGGVLSHLEVFLPVFSVTPKVVQGGQTAIVVNTPGLQITFWKFLRDFGIPLFLFFPALIFLRKKWPWPLLWLFAFGILISILIPFFVHYLFPRELLRFFYLASAFLALLASVYLAWLFFETTETAWKKRLIGAIFVLMILNGLIFQLTYLVFPLGKISREPQRLFATYPRDPITPMEERAKQWLLQNTTIDDWFFAVDFTEEEYTSTNHRFVVLFGRLAPAYHYIMSQPVNSVEARIYKNLIKSCQAEDLKALKYSYIYVDNLWPDGLEAICLENNELDLVYEDYDEDNFIRIYKINL
jgi:hypothetical protein